MIKDRIFQQSKLIAKQLLLIVILCFSLLSQAQQIECSQLIKTQELLNPAFYGTRSSAGGMMLYRNQWHGVSGAPKSQALNVHLPLKDKNITIGLTIENYTWSFFQKFDSYVTLAYVIRVGDCSKLSFGFQGGFNAFNVVPSKMIGETDPAFMNYSPILLPNFGTGIFYHNKNYFAGYSLPELLYQTTSFANHNPRPLNISKMEHYFYTGYVLKQSEYLVLKPTLSLRYLDGMSTNFQANIHALFNNVLWLGLGWRNEQIATFFADIKLKTIRISYAYDWNLNTVNNILINSHEIRLSFDMFTTEEMRIHAIRYF